MALSNKEKQAAYRLRKAGLRVTVTITPEAKAVLDQRVESGKSQGQVISEALIKFEDTSNDPV